MPLSFNDSFQLLSPVNQTLHSQPHATGCHHQLPFWVPVWQLHRCLTLQCWVVGHNAVFSDEGWASCASHIFHSMGIRCSTELRQRLSCGIVGSHTGSRYRGLGSEYCFRLNSCFIAQLQLITQDWSRAVMGGQVAVTVGQVIVLLQLLHQGCVWVKG